MRLRYVCLAVLVLVFSVTLAAQTNPNPQSSAAPQASQARGQESSPSLHRSVIGKRNVHGVLRLVPWPDGKGNGPAAAALKTPPTNLTLLAVKNGGTFPDARIMQIIKGDSMTAAHGNKEMPVWGPMFLQMARA